MEKKIIVRTSQLPREILEQAYREIQAKKAQQGKKETSSEEKSSSAAS
jgi:hypothetical protein